MIYLGRILSAVITIYMIILTVRVFISWLSLPYARWIYYIEKITNPAINFFRKNFPLRIGIFDISIVFLFASLSILQMLINDLMVYGQPLTFGYMLSFLVFIFKLLVNFVIFSLILGTAILIFISFTTGAVFHPIVSAFKALIDPFIMLLARIFKLRTLNAARIYLIILLVILIITGFVADKLLLMLYYYLRVI